MTPTTIGEDELRAILDGLEGVTPGPWDVMRQNLRASDRSGHWSVPLQVGKQPNGGNTFAEVYMGGPAATHNSAEEVSALAEHIARLDPETVRSIVTELLDRRKDGLGTVSVSALHWHRVTQGFSLQRAATKFGDYRIWVGNDGGWFWAFNDQKHSDGAEDSEEAVIAACQSDFETRVKSCLTSIGVDAGHPDDLAVDRFAAAMKAKLAEKRLEGRGGWELKDECSAEHLSVMLRNHVEKGDPLDVGNFAMMLHQRGDRITS